jgi:exosortase
LRLVAACFVVERFDEWSLMPFAAGLALVAGGWAALRWAWPSIVFMYFMTPLPGSVQDRLGPFLQKIGTLASIYLIQAMSIPAVRRGADGNVIQLPGAQLGVAEACSGIRMLMLFFAICVGAAFVLRCPLWKKAVIVVSAVPIAVFSNVIRITVTAVLYELSRRWPTRISEDAAKWLFHDGAGLLMMPLAMVLVFILWHLLGRLVVEEAPEGPLALGSSLSQGRPAGKPQSNSKP